MAVDSSASSRRKAQRYTVVGWTMAHNAPWDLRSEFLFALSKSSQSFFGA